MPPYITIQEEGCIGSSLLFGFKTVPGALRHTCVGSDAVEMLEHSNRRSRLSFFNIKMMETLRHRESTRGGRRGDCPRGRRAGPEAAVLLSGGYPLREKLGGSEQGKAGDRGKRRLRGDGAEGPLLVSMYFSPFSPTHFRQSRQRGYAGFANADAPLSASRRHPPSRPHRRLTRPSGGTTGPLS